MAISRKLRHILIVLLCTVVVLVAAYAAFGYHYAPGLVREQAIAFVRKAYGRELGIGAVRVDPFRLRLEVRDLRLPDADGQPMLAARRFLVDFEVASLWRRAWVFRAIELEQPQVRVVQRVDGQFNLVDLARPRGPQPAPSSKPAPIPRIWLQYLAVTGGSVEYFEAARAQPLVKRIAPIGFTLRDFRTAAEGGHFVLSARTAADERFEWRGSIAVAPQLTSSGEFSIAQLHLTTLMDLLPEPPPLAVGSGVIDLAGHYDFKLADAVGLTLDLPQLSVSNLGVGADSAATDWINVDRIALEQVHFDLAASTLHATRLNIAGLKARTWLDAGGRFNLPQLLPASKPQPAPASGSAATTRRWKAGIDALQVAATIDFEDRRLHAPPHIQLTPIDISTGALSMDLARAVPLQLSARINDAARLQVQGTITPAPLAATLNVTLADAPLQILQPYVLPVADLSIPSGTLSTAGRLVIEPTRGGTPAIRFEGDASVDRLRSVDNTLHEDLLNLRRLQVQKLRYSSAPAGLRIERVLVDEPYARVVISPEQVVNIGAVFNPQAAAAQLAERRAVQAGVAPAPRQESRSAKRAPEQALPVETDAPEAFPIRIGAVRVGKGRINFSDFSIRPNFSAEILDLTGAVTALSSARSSRATVDLKGNLGEFSPVTIQGTFRPFAFDRFTDIGMKFENIALPVFNPYSGVFAGYNIAKGKLTTELHYQISDRKLNATHHIRIDQLEWGDASEFKSEATLPVKFATALLRDRDGVINLDIPVTGSLGDPQFRLGPIIWQVIKNVIVKAATSPFALLGSLFPGAEDAQFVDFQPGDAVIDAATSEKLASLAKGLAGKPGILLDIPLATAPEQDRPALAARRFQQLLDAAAPDYAALDATHQRQSLTAWLRAQNRSVPAIPAPAAPPAGTTREQARVLADQLAVSVLEQTLHDGITVSDGDLEQLAQARATAIQSMLLRAGELDPARVFIVREPRMKVNEGRIRLQLNIK